jgi:hypothetical protein
MVKAPHHHRPVLASPGAEAGNPDDINTVVLTGRLTANPELRSTVGGVMSCRVRIASNRARVASFHTVALWVTLASELAEFARRGDRIGVRGQLRESSWTQADGTAATAPRWSPPRCSSPTSCRADRLPPSGALSQNAAPF